MVIHAFNQLPLFLLTASFWHLNSLQGTATSFFFLFKWKQQLRLMQTRVRLTMRNAAFHSSDSEEYFPGREGTWGQFLNPFFPLPHQGRKKKHFYLNPCQNCFCFLAFSEYQIRYKVAKKAIDW